LRGRGAKAPTAASRNTQPSPRCFQSGVAAPRIIYGFGGGVDRIQTSCTPPPKAGKKVSLRQASASAHASPAQEPRWSPFMNLNGSGAPAPPKAASQACHGPCSSACLRSGSCLHPAQICVHSSSNRALHLNLLHSFHSYERRIVQDARCPM